MSVQKNKKKIGKRERERIGKKNNRLLNYTVLSKNGAHVITESMGEIQESPSATPFKLLLMVPAF